MVSLAVVVVTVLPVVVGNDVVVVDVRKVPLVAVVVDRMVLVVVVVDRQSTWKVV